LHLPYSPSIALPGDQQNSQWACSVKLPFLITIVAVTEHYTTRRSTEHSVQREQKIVDDNAMIIFHENTIDITYSKPQMRLFLVWLDWVPLWKHGGASILLSKVENSVTEPHHFYAAPAPAPGVNFDAAPAAPAPAPAPTLLYSKAKFLKLTKVITHVETIFFIWFWTNYIAENISWMGCKLLHFVSF
jgi:hypothetical protein